MAKSKLIQFNWRRHWRARIEPHLQDEDVLDVLKFGLRQYTPGWSIGDPPHIIGAIDGRRRVPGKLSWYQPVGRCHFIAPRPRHRRQGLPRSEVAAVEERQALRGGGARG